MKAVVKEVDELEKEVRKLIKVKAAEYCARLSFGGDVKAFQKTAESVMRDDLRRRLLNKRFESVRGVK